MHRDQPALARIVEEDPAHRVGHREHPAAAGLEAAVHLAHHSRRIIDERNRAEGGEGQIKGLVGDRQSDGVGLHQRYAYPGLVRLNPGVPQHAGGQVQRDHLGTLCCQPP